MNTDQLLDQAEAAYYDGDHEPSLLVVDREGMPIFAGYVNRREWAVNVATAITGINRTCLDATHAVFTFQGTYHLVPEATVLAHRGQAVPVQGPGNKIVIFGVVELSADPVTHYRVLDEDRQPVPGMQLEGAEDPIVASVRKFRAIYPNVDASLEDMIAELHASGVLDAGVMFER